MLEKINTGKIETKEGDSLILLRNINGEVMKVKVYLVDENINDFAKLTIKTSDDETVLCSEIRELKVDNLVYPNNLNAVSKTGNLAETGQVTTFIPFTVVGHISVEIENASKGDSIEDVIITIKK